MGAERIEAHPRSSREARRLLRTVLAHGDAEHLVEVATLLTSELVANALRHGRPPIDLTIALDEVRLVVTVRDRGAGATLHPAGASLQATSGRGLDIVDSLAESWGSASAQPGTSVWFTLLVT